MAMRVVGGGERYVGKATIPLYIPAEGEGEPTSVDEFEVVMPPGANLAVISPQLFSTNTALVLVKRDSAPAVTDFEASIAHREEYSEVFKSGGHIHGLVVTSTLGTATPGESDSIVIRFYTNLAGRA